MWGFFLKKNQDHLILMKDPQIILTSGDWNNTTLYVFKILQQKLCTFYVQNDTSMGDDISLNKIYSVA